ncbi:MAG: KpsF/GutQ family sugar-phosphate isomerase [Pseudomonadales bacterium]|nr:KpsF/GutQ family sugar-phosphate isomerase [Pseudomonadales bacterium]
MTDPQQFIDAARRTVEMEAKSVNSLADKIDADFVTACQLILACEGRVVVTGMGKSGHICNKIAATLASTGTPAFFVHPGEASHGDLGMITRKDVVLAVSNSGTTAELITILPLIKRMGAPLISMTGAPDSVLAQAAHAHLDVSVEQEACPLGLAPTSSTTAALVMGDALAIALLEARGFSAEDFAFSHPGGALGRRLLLKVEDIMHTGDAIPIVKQKTALSHALLEVTAKKLGITTIVNDSGVLLGIFTDGDLRRTLDQGLDIHATPIEQVMTTHCKTIDEGRLAAEALNLMQDNKINALVVVDQNHRPVGALNMHDLLRAGVI